MSIARVTYNLARKVQVGIDNNLVGGPRGECDLSTEYLVFGSALHFASFQLRSGFFCILSLSIQDTKLGMGCS
jgi:hypothetical protein